MPEVVLDEMNLETESHNRLSLASQYNSTKDTTQHWDAGYERFVDKVVLANEFNSIPSESAQYPYPPQTE